MTLREAEKTLLAKLPHSSECRRNDLGMWDRSGTCERCNAFLARADAQFGPR